ncbi:TPA: hypothetical protein N3D36_004881 [Salmonella enterica subsp. enterica serovar Lehrte]|nr:hypothetical protein [Salmonella enterica subsp. enterica serovar Essen]HCM2492375.1 hypothetical protein [Salmonella enterica subsp. enterica serovar Lehrte]HCM2495648.1 hypothetical protein [Salmonella enterica subsp. enterica serovar Lehrte]
MRYIAMAVMLFFSGWATAAEEWWPPESEMIDGFYPVTSGTFVSTDVLLKIAPKLLKPGVTLFMTTGSGPDRGNIFSASGKYGKVKDNQNVHGKTCKAFRKTSLMVSIDAPMTADNGYWICVSKLQEDRAFYIRLDDPVLNLK